MADTKISGLTAKDTPVAADVGVIVDSVGGANKKILLGNIPLTGNIELKALATGILKNTTTTGTPSIATTADYVAPITAVLDDLEFSGSAITGVNGEAGAMAFGDMVFCFNAGTSTTPTFKLAKGNAAADLLFPVVMVCVEPLGIAGGASGAFMHSGYLRNDAWSDTLAVGAVAGCVWLSVTGTTTNTWTQTMPTASNNIQQMLGYMVNDAWSAAHSGKSKTMFFNPWPWNKAA